MASKFFINRFAHTLIFWGVWFIFISCEEDLTKINEKKSKIFASQIIHKAEWIQRDSGKVKIWLRAPLIEKYEYIDSPYVEARKGLYLEFYDGKKGTKPGKIWADYAKAIEIKEIYEAKGNVKVVNNEGQTFRMKSIYWDKKKKLMYTRDTVHMTDLSGNVFTAAQGMTAKDDFSEYQFNQNSGQFDINNLPKTGQ